VPARHAAEVCAGAWHVDSSVAPTPLSDVIPASAGHHDVTRCDMVRWNLTHELQMGFWTCLVGTNGRQCLTVVGHLILRLLLQWQAKVAVGYRHRGCEGIPWYGHCGSALEGTIVCLLIVGWRYGTQ
jgi:hypothetical protein